MKKTTYVQINFNKLFIVLLFITSCRTYAKENNFTIGGEGKIRFRYIDATIDQISGTYGENLKKGFSLRQRIDLLLNVPLTKYLSVNAALRITNEDSRDILPPPDLISMKALAGWWSLDFEKTPFNAIVGAYDASFTPLTFMRWDPKDNPLGASGCACQSSVGGISGESLEDPQEDYKIEGIKLESYGELGDITVLFARPEIAIDEETYARHMYGARGRFITPSIRYIPSFAIGITGLRIKDNIQSVDTVYYTHPPQAPFQSDVFGIDIDFPIVWNISFIAEYAKSIRDDNLLTNENSEKDDDGITGGVQLLNNDKIEANLIYLKMETNFSPFYRAVSYKNNQEGYRSSFIYRNHLFSRPLSISGYFKKLREIEPTQNIRRIPLEEHTSISNYTIGNFALNMEFFDNWKLGGTYEYRKIDRLDDASTVAIETIDQKTNINSLSLTYEFTIQSTLTFKHQIIDHIDTIDGENSYKAYLPTLQFSVKF